MPSEPEIKFLGKENDVLFFTAHYRMYAMLPDKSIAREDGVSPEGDFTKKELEFINSQYLIIENEDQGAKTPNDSTGTPSEISSKEENTESTGPE